METVESHRAYWKAAEFQQWFEVHYGTAKEAESNQQVGRWNMTFSIASSAWRAAIMALRTEYADPEENPAFVADHPHTVEDDA